MIFDDVGTLLALQKRQDRGSIQHNGHAASSHWL
jgi:hypothetical protein